MGGFKRSSPNPKRYSNDFDNNSPNMGGGKVLNQ